MLAFDIAFLISLFIVLLGVSVFDRSKAVIPNCLSIIYLVLSLVYYFVHLNTSWYLPLIFSASVFVLFFILYLITGENIIGGGDVKIISISLLMLNSIDALWKYFIYLSIFTFIGAFICKIRKEKYLRCGVWLSLSIICTLLPLTFDKILLITLVFMIVTLTLSELFFWKERLENDEKYFLFFEK